MATLPNGKPIDMEMLEMALEDANMANTYFLNILTGEVVFPSEYDDVDEQEKLVAEKSMRATIISVLTVFPLLKPMSGWSPSRMKWLLHKMS